MTTFVKVNWPLLNEDLSSDKYLKLYHINYNEKKRTRLWRVFFRLFQIAVFRGFVLPVSSAIDLPKFVWIIKRIMKYARLLLRN